MFELDFSPATPKQPQLALVLSLLDWMEALMQECQEDYAAALSFLSDGHVLPRKGATLRLGCLHLDPRGQESFNQFSLTVLRNTGEIDSSDS